MDGFDTKPPGNYNDEDLLNEDTATKPSPQATFTDTSIQIALFHSMKVRLQVATYLNHFRSVSTYDKTLELNMHLTTASRGFDALLHLYQAQQPGLSEFQLAITEHIIQRYFLALHLPWRGPAKEDPRYYFSRKMCIEVALRNQKNQAHGFLGADTGPEPDDFGRLLICASSRYRYIGTRCVLALTIVLIWELQERRSAIRSLITGDTQLTTPTAASHPASTPGMGFGLLGSPTSQSSETIDVIHQSTKWMRARIMAGEVNVKGYLFSSAMCAEAIGLHIGLSDIELTPLVLEVAKEAAKTSFDILKGLFAEEVDEDAEGNSGSTTNKEGGATAPAPMDTGIDGTRLPETAAAVQCIDTGSSSSLSDWDWDAVRTSSSD